MSNAVWYDSVLLLFVLLLVGVIIVLGGHGSPKSNVRGTYSWRLERALQHSDTRSDLRTLFQKLGETKEGEMIRKDSGKTVATIWIDNEELALRFEYDPNVRLR